MDLEDRRFNSLRGRAQKVAWGMLVGAAPLLTPFVPSIVAQEPNRFAKVETLIGLPETIEKLRQAESILQSVIEVEPSDYEAWWRLSRVYYSLGDDVNLRKEKLRYFQQGIDAGERAVALQRNRVEGHYWLGVNHGGYGEARGSIRSLKSVSALRKEVQQAIKIDPTFMHAGAYMVLGRLDFELPWLFGNKKRAIETYEKGLQVDGTNSLMKIYLAESLLDAKRLKEARQQLEEVLTMRVAPDYQAEHEENIVKARKLLEKRFTQ